MQQFGLEDELSLLTLSFRPLAKSQPIQCTMPCAD
jgi:hypothetical protein